MDRPILLADSVNGANVVQKALAAKSMTVYLKLRGTQVGFYQNVKFYSFYHATAGKLVQNLTPH